MLTSLDEDDARGVRMSRVQQNIECLAGTIADGTLKRTADDRGHDGRLSSRFRNRPVGSVQSNRIPQKPSPSRALIAMVRAAVVLVIVVAFVVVI